jgi:integrase
MGALRWDDIDFEHGIISVQRSLVWKGYSPSEGWMLVPPKTERGRRQITIPESLTSALLVHKQRQQEAKRKLGTAYEDNNFVFANRWGRPIFPRQFVRRVFKVALARAGLPKTIRLYDLRHTCATLLLKAGEHIKVVSERLGHANISITLETYAHVLPGMQEGAATKMESLLSDSDGTPEAHEQAHRADEDEH